MARGNIAMLDLGILNYSDEFIQKIANIINANNKKFNKTDSTSTTKNINDEYIEQLNSDSFIE